LRDVHSFFEREGLLSESEIVSADADPPQLGESSQFNFMNNRHKLSISFDALPCESSAQAS
jgi:hypothetical protein